MQNIKANNLTATPPSFCAVIFYPHIWLHECNTHKQIKDLVLQLYLNSNKMDLTFILLYYHEQTQW